MTTRGMLLNNPMNIMHNPTFTWVGEEWPSADPEGRLCQFNTMANGIRAGAKNLLAYFNKDGCKTIAQIIARYAPSVENNTSAYVSYVAMQCDVDPNAVLDLSDPTLLRLIVSAIVHYEQGVNTLLSYNDLAQGIEEALT